MKRAALGAFALSVASGLAGCGSCDKRGVEPADAGGASSSAAASAAVVAEVLPRCRADAQRLALPGDDIVVGDVAVAESGLLVGLVRVQDGKRVQSILRAALDLSKSGVVDLGVAWGDDPPPSPRWNGVDPWGFSVARVADAGTRVRKLLALRLGVTDFSVGGAVEQQADESTAFDVAWSESGGGLLAAWDEDAPHGSAKVDGGADDRGFVKVQAIGGDAGRPRVVSPETSDAESPRLLPRPGGGYWLAWLAQKVEDEGYAVEGPGERRAYRWVEVLPLDAHGEPAGPVRRVSSEKGRATSFELARSGDELLVMIQDEAARAEGGGARMVRHHVGAAGVDASDLVDGGVGHSLAEVVPTAGGKAGARIELDGGAARWLAWSDVAERAHLTPLGASLLPNAPASAEPTLDGMRVLASVREAAGDVLVVLSGPAPEKSHENDRGRPELRRFVCH